MLSSCACSHCSALFLSIPWLSPSKPRQHGSGWLSTQVTDGQRTPYRHSSRRTYSAEIPFTTAHLVIHRTRSWGREYAGNGEKSAKLVPQLSRELRKRLPCMVSRPLHPAPGHPSSWQHQVKRYGARGEEHRAARAPL